MLKEIQELGPPLKPGDIDDLEQLVGLTLPEDYRGFLLEHNGGRPEPDNFEITGFEGNPIGSIQTFLGLRHPPPLMNLDWYAKEAPHLFYNSGLQPIAHTPGGDILVISCSPKSRGQIHYWDSWNAPKRVTSKDLYFVAESISALLVGLFDDRSTFTLIENLIKDGDLKELEALISRGYDLNEIDEYGRNALEIAVVLNRPEVVRLFYRKGAKLRAAMSIAEQNFEFFPRFSEMITVISELEHTDQSQG